MWFGIHHHHVLPVISVQPILIKRIFGRDDIPLELQVDTPPPDADEPAPRIPRRRLHPGILPMVHRRSNYRIYPIWCWYIFPFLPLQPSCFRMCFGASTFQQATVLGGEDARRGSSLHGLHWDARGATSCGLKSY